MKVVSLCSSFCSISVHCRQPPITHSVPRHPPESVYTPHPVHTTDDPLALSPGPPRPTPRGPFITPSEFDMSHPLRSPSSSPEMDTMVHQVTAVLPQVPYTVIRRDLSEC